MLYEAVLLKDKNNSFSKSQQILILDSTDIFFPMRNKMVHNFPSTYKTVKNLRSQGNTSTTTSTMIPCLLEITGPFTCPFCIRAQPIIT